MLWPLLEQQSFLYTGITLANLIFAGTIPVERDKLIRYVKGLAKYSIFDLTYVMLIPSNPFVLPDLKLVDRCLISFSVTGFRKIISEILSLRKESGDLLGCGSFLARLGPIFVKNSQNLLAMAIGSVISFSFHKKVVGILDLLRFFVYHFI